MNFVLEEV